MFNAPPSSPSLKQSLKRLLTTAVAILNTRLSLLSLEWIEERQSLLKLLLLCMIAIGFLGLGLLTLSALVVMVLWDNDHRYWILMLGFTYLLVGLCLYLLVVKRLKTMEPFSETRLQLAKDRELLKEYATRPENKETQ